MNSGVNLLDKWYFGKFINGNKFLRFEITEGQGSRALYGEDLQAAIGFICDNNLVNMVLYHNRYRRILRPSTKINKFLVGESLYFYNGETVEQIIITEKMIGYRICEFAMKRKLIKKEKIVLNDQLRKRSKLRKCIKKLIKTFDEQSKLGKKETIKTKDKKEDKEIEEPKTDVEEQKKEQESKNLEIDG